MKILMAVDGSSYTKRMLSYVAAHDELLGPNHEYLLLTVVTAVPPHAARHLDRQLLADYYRDEAATVFKPLLAFADQQKWRVSTLAEQGHVADVIATVAEQQKFDLVVMGTHGHSSLGALVLGSVTTGVLARCKTPLLLIR